MSELLQITQGASSDNSIMKKELHSYSPFLTSFKNSDEIRISIQHQDLYILPNESFIYIEGELTKSDGSKAENTKLVNNAFAFLFEEVRYELNGVEIDRTRNMGIATILKNYVSLSDNESKMSFNASWMPENFVVEKGFFNFCVPIRMLLGFAEDYKKIIANAKHEIVLIRSRTNENAYITTPAADGKIEDIALNIHKIQWKVPHIAISDSIKLSLLQKIERGHPIQIAFRSWDIYEYPSLPKTTHQTWAVKTSTQLEKPRFIILALQTNRRDQKTKDASKFDHCSLTDIKVYLNSESFPYDDMNLNFERGRYALLYDMYIKFQQSYYGRQSQPLLSARKFKEEAPIAIIDCSHQNEAIKTGPVDIRLEFKSLTNIPEGTSAYCLILHDRIVEYSPLTSEVRKHN